MLKLNDVTWLYQHLPMRFTLDVARGERIAVLGPSGAGKSTLLNLIAGFLPPASGTVRQNISLGIHPGLKLSREQQAQVAAMAGQMGIDALLERLPGELSGGQRQRAALARCLVRQQPVLLLDEPFSALDPALRQEMLSLVADVCEQQQLTLLMVSHSVEDAARIAPRSIVVAEGRIVWDGATAELLSGNSSASHLMGISAQ